MNKEDSQNDKLEEINSDNYGLGSPAVRMYQE